MDFSVHDAFENGRWLLWIPLLPLLGAIINGLLGRWATRATVTAVGVGSVGMSFLLGLVFWARLISISGSRGPHEAGTDVTLHAYDWFSVTLNGASVPVGVTLTMDHLSAVMTLVVTGVGALIHLYAVGYMANDKSYSRFFCYLNLFTASMLILVLAGNLPLMFVGWEGVGLCSYLLIGFWWETPAYAAAGRKAFVMNRIGDFGVLIGMFLLASAAGSFDFAQINGRAALLLGDVQIDHVHSLHVTTATVACLFLFLGCAGKSAQIPLYTWLPDAMAGPTPVSALIHAATMVTSGIYLCCRLSPVFVMSPVAMSTIALIGAATALFAATIALVQNEMKKILAYSTVSQLGFMFAAVGVGAFSGGIFHVFTHAFFKACLFLGAGSVMHAVGAHGDADIRKLGGMRSRLPTTHWTFLVACLAIAGFPLTSGFFSKDDILLGAVLGGQAPWADFPSWVGWVVYGTLALAATMTAFYMFRLYFLTFGGEYRRTLPHVHAEGETHSDDEPHDHPYDDEPHESPWTMTAPLQALAAGALLVGLLGLPAWWHLGNYWEHWLEPSLASLPRIGELAADVERNAGIIALVTSLAACLGGIGVAWSFYGREGNQTPANIAQSAGALYRGAMAKWKIDEFYDLVVVRPAKWLAWFAGAFDKAFVDGILSGLTSLVVRGSSWLFTRPQNGVVYAYGTVMVVGVAVLLGWVVVPHPGLQHVERGNEVKMQAGTGLGYEYRWDTNGDGTFDTEWDKDHTEVDTTYDDPADYRGGAIVVSTLGISGTDEDQILLEQGRWSTLPASALGVGWQAVPGEGAPPGITWRDGKVVVRPNGAVVLRGTQTINEETALSPGDVITVGVCQIRPAAVVRGTVEVRNAFGYVARESADVVITPAPAAHAALTGGR